VKKKNVAMGELLFGKKEHKRQMRRVRQSEKEERKTHSVFDKFPCELLKRRKK